MLCLHDTISLRLSMLILPVNTPKQVADAAFRAVLGFLHTQPWPVPERCHWGVTCTFTKVHLRAFRQGQCLNWVRLKCRSTSWCHSTGVLFPALGLHKPNLCCVSWMEEEGEHRPCRGPGCHRKGTATGRALPQGGHCHRGGTGSASPIPSVLSPLSRFRSPLQFSTT